MIGAFAPFLLGQVVVIPPNIDVRVQKTSDDVPWHIVADNAQLIDENTYLKKGSVIARQRLVPKRLAVLDGPAVRADGKDRWAEEGDQLFGAIIAELDAYCVLKSKVNLTVGMFIVPASTRMIKQDCFVDSDDDGLMDQRFEADPGIGVLPNVARSRPQAFYPITPVQVRFLESRDFLDDSWISIEFRSGGKNEKDPPVFQVSYHYDGKTRKLSDLVSSGAKSFPSSFALLGAEIGLDKDANGKLRAKVIKPMEGDFGVLASMVYR